jgi:hypothetical protein
MTAQLRAVIPLSPLAFVSTMNFFKGAVTAVTGVTAKTMFSSREGFYQGKNLCDRTMPSHRAKR